MKRLKLLIPLDGSDFSRQIIASVRQLFDPAGVDVHLFHVAEPPVARHEAAYRPALLGHDATLYPYGLGTVGGIDPALGGTVERGAGSRATPERHEVYRPELDDYREALLERLQRDVALVRGHGYEATATVHFGEPVHEIADLALHEHVDLVAMTTHNRSGLGRLFRGSVALDVLERLPIPVLLLNGTAFEEVHAASGDAPRDALRGVDETAARRRDETAPDPALDPALDPATGRL